VALQTVSTSTGYTRPVRRLAKQMPKAKKTSGSVGRNVQRVGIDALSFIILTGPFAVVVVSGTIPAPETLNRHLPGPSKSCP